MTQKQSATQPEPTQGAKNLIFDILFYIIFPYLIWNQGKEMIGDYYAILFSTVPPILYTIYKFIKERQFNFTGIFLVTVLLSKAIVDILSGEAERMLINQVYMMFVLGFIILMTIFIKRPLGLYFLADTSQLIGLEKNKVLSLCKEKELFQMLNIFTMLFSFRYIVTGIVKLFLIYKYGVEGYGKMIVIMQVVSWTFTIIIGFYTYKIFSNLTSKIK